MYKTDEYVHEIMKSMNKGSYVHVLTKNYHFWKPRNFMFTKLKAFAVLKYFALCGKLLVIKKKQEGNNSFHFEHTSAICFCVKQQYLGNKKKYVNICSNPTLYKCSLGRGSQDMDYLGVANATNFYLLISLPVITEQSESLAIQKSVLFNW